MHITYIEGGFVEIINNGIVEKIVCEYGDGQNGSCTVFFCNKSSKIINTKCSSYNLQYSIPLSFDSKKIFVGSWESGLYAYDIYTGDLVWRYRRGKIQDIFVREKYIIASRAHTAIVKIDVDTGEVLAEIKSGSLEKIFCLDDTCIFADTVSGKYCVVDTDRMIIAKKYPLSVVNPNKCLSLLIQSTVLKDNRITISGVEDYPQRMYDFQKVSGGQQFSRIIDDKFVEELE